MPTIQILTATTVLVTGARWLEVHKEIPYAIVCAPCTVWSPGDPFFTAAPYDSGGNGIGEPIILHLSRCGRLVVGAHGTLAGDSAWCELGYPMDRDSPPNGRDSADLFNFLADFFAGGLSADFDGDGSVTVADFFDWLSCFLST